MRPFKIQSLFLLVFITLAGCGGPTPTIAPTQRLLGAYPAGGNSSLSVTSGTAYPTSSGGAYPAGATSPATTADQTATFVIVPEKTTASYSIDETLFNENNRINTAIGATNQVTGQLVLDYRDPTHSAFGEFVVDISTLKSDKTMRDNRIRSQWLESSKFPLATFTVKEVRNFPANPQEGQALTFQLVGDLKIKETTHETVWDVTATLNGDELTGTATTAFLLADFNIPVPSVAGILSVTDGLTVTLEFTFQKQ